MIGTVPRIDPEQEWDSAPCRPGTAPLTPVVPGPQQRCCDLAGSGRGVTGTGCYAAAVNRSVVQLLVLVVASVLVYSNTFDNGFHYDDAHRVQYNPGVQEFWPPWRHFADPATSATLPRVRQYRPLLPLSLSINYAIAGDSLVGYHVGNLLLQILAAFALFLLARELFTHWSKAPLPGYAAGLVALLFAVHPVSGIVVNYICARDLTMMQLFALASLWAYARMRRLGETAGRWSLCLGLLLLSLLAKKNSVVAPLLVLLFELFPAGQSIRSTAVWRRVGVVAGLVGGFLLFVRFGLNFSDYGNVVSTKMSSAEYGARQLQHHVFHYLCNFVWPLPIRQGGEDPIAAWKQAAGLLVIVGAFVLAWRCHRRQPLVSFSIGGYAAMLALTSTVIVFHSEIVAYRPYPASAFLFLLLGAVLLRQPRIGVPVFVVAAIALGAASYHLNTTWKDTESATRHSVAYGGAPDTYARLAAVLAPGPEPVKLFEFAAQNSEDVFIKFGLAKAEVECGTATNNRELQNRGLQRLGQLLSRVSANAQARYTAAQILYGVRHIGDSLQKAADQAERASVLAPDNLVYRCMAGMCAVEAQRFQKGLQILQPLLATRPDFSITRLVAGIAYMELRQFATAEPLFVQFLAANPQHWFGWRHLGMTRMGMQNWAGAAQALQAAAQGDPNIPGVREALAQCRQRLGGR